MKKLFRFLAATALVAFAAACGQDGADPYNPTSGDTDVTFSVAAPGGVASRAVADGLKATELQWAIYLTGDLEKADMAPVQQGTATFVNRETEVKVRLVAGKSYDIIFWAQDPDCTDYAIDWMTKKLSITYNDVEEGNNDDRDAFLWVERNLKVNGAIEKDIWLYRPFAQLNVGISYADINVALQHKYELAGTKVKASTYTQFDFTAVGTDKDGNYLPGKPVGEMKEITFDWAAPVSKNQTTDVEKLKLNDGSEYFWASFNYLLADTPASTTDVAIWFNYTTDSKEEPIGPFTWVPIERNHRTNIVGDLLTDPATFKVYIDNEFDEPAHELTPWNGKLEPLPVAGADGFINIETPGQMATLLANASGLKAKLAEDLDMAGYTVAVNPELTRNLELDGQGHSVKNLVVESGAKVNGLFPSLVSSTVKNLVIDGIVVMPAAARAQIEGDYYAGALAGATYGTVNVEKVTVKGAKVAGVNKVGGLVGFVAENVLNVDGAVVEASEVSTLSEADGGNVGGLIGYVTPNATVKNSTVKNTKIVAINSAGAAKRANSEFIGAFHGSDNTTLEIEKAVIEGNTFAETANGYVAPDYFLGLVGGNRNGGGKVIIDGKEATDAVPSPWCLIGVNGDWTKDVPMVVAENGMAVAYGIELKEGNFKVRIPNDDGSWNDAANYGVDPSVAGAKVYANMPIPVFTGGGSSNIVPVVYATYDIYFDEANKVVYLMEAGKPVSEAVEFEKFREKLNLAEGNTWGIVGTFTDWGEDIATMEIGEIDGELWAVAKNLKITAADEFKFRANGQWTLNYGGPQDMEIGKLYEGIINSSNNMSVAADGYYNLYFSMDYATIKIEAGNAPVITPEIVKVSAESLEFAAEGGEQTIEIDLVGEAELQITKPEWVSINVAENVLTVSVAANETTEVIEGVIVLTYGESTVTIPVAQAAAEAVEPEPSYELAVLDASKNYYYKKVTEFVPGKWYLWATGEGRAAQGLTGNYGYLKELVAISDGDVVSAPARAAFGVLPVEGGYTIQQWDGKYVYMSGSYDSFNVAAEMPAEGAVWTIDADAEGTYTIKNVLKGKWAQFDPTYNSFGSYDSQKGANPVLYELTEVDNTPQFLSVSAESLSFSADGGSKTVTANIYGEGEVTASADQDWVSTSVAGNVVTVTVAANEVEEARNAVVTISFAGVSKTVAISQAAKPAEGGDVVVEGGRDDFSTLTNSTQYGALKTKAGWVGANCAVQSGGSNDSNPVFNSLLGSDSSVKGMVINGKTTAVGSITSPVLTTGCGTLSLNYGGAFSEGKGISFKIEIMQNGAAVQTYEVKEASYTKFKVHEWSQEINVAGEFQIVITNNHPSNNTGNKDRYTIWNIEWTGFAN